jgi:hypothetical protein
MIFFLGAVHRVVLMRRRGVMGSGPASCGCPQVERRGGAGPLRKRARTPPSMACGGGPIIPAKGRLANALAPPRRSIAPSRKGRGKGKRDTAPPAPQRIGPAERWLRPHPEERTQCASRRTRAASMVRDAPSALLTMRPRETFQNPILLPQPYSRRALCYGRALTQPKGHNSRHAERIRDKDQTQHSRPRRRGVNGDHARA